MFLKAFRNGLGTVIAGLDCITRPKKQQRSVEAQARVDAAAADLQLYQFYGCPFCIKVRRTLHRLNVPVVCVDINKSPSDEQTLIQQGGKRQVPCLRITEQDGSVQWLYESKAIIDYLQTRFADEP